MTRPVLASSDTATPNRYVYWVLGCSALIRYGNRFVAGTCNTQKKRSLQLQYHDFDIALYWCGVVRCCHQKNRPGYALYLAIRRALLALLGAHMCVAFAAFVWPSSGFSCGFICRTVWRCGCRLWWPWLMGAVRVLFVLNALSAQGLMTNELGRAGALAMDCFDLWGDCGEYRAARAQFIALLPPGFVLQF